MLKNQFIGRVDKLVRIVFIVLFIAFNLSAKAKNRPNILFIIVDDLRTELNCYGADYIKSPNIDKLAENGALFTRAYCQQAVCAASRASFLTGCRPNTTGVDYPYSQYFVNEFWPARPTIAEFFEKSGYEVRTFGKIHHGPSDKIKAKHYIPKGLKYYALDENIALGGEKGRSKNTPPFECADLPDEAYQDGMIANETVKNIKELSGKEKPFFLAVGFKKPHLPFCAPKKYWDLYNKEEIGLAPNREHPVGSPEYSTAHYSLKSYSGENDADGNVISDDRQMDLRHAYAACVSYIDEQIGKLMTQIEQSGELENTVVMFISDHGWHLGHQAMWGKTTNFENSALAPMIVSVPGKVKGIKLDQLVEYVDVYPTLVELAGFEPADYLEGTSYVELLNNPERSWKKAAFSQFPRGTAKEGFAIRTEDFRYIEWRDGKDNSLLAAELYDHRIDSLETKNVAENKDYNEIVNVLANQLKQGWKAALPEGITNNSDNPLAPPSVAWGPEANNTSTKPNILLIQVDDMGYDDLSINGNTLSHTPNLDAFSKSAVRFGNFMVNSVCAPTRASLLTGRDFWRTGVSAMHGGNDYLHLDESTFANIFQENGYTTGMWGKWHSGKSDGYWPWDRGFDEGYYAKLYNFYPSNGWFNEYPKKTTHDGQWSPKVLVDYTIDFIDRNKQKPFLAYLSFLTCHDIWKTPDSYKNKYLVDGRTERFATLLGMLEFMDEEVGRLLKFLKDNGLDENTVVLFMSDNGPNLGDTNPTEWSLRNNHGFLGNKARLWQNGLKSPLYIRWNGKYEAINIDRLVSVTDIFPTLLDIADIPLPANNLPLDGRSIKSYLEGDTTSLDEKSAVFSHWVPEWTQGQFSPIQPDEKAAFNFNIQKITLINEHHKFLFNPVNVTGSPEKYQETVLIDIKADPLERTNIAASSPEIADSMKQELEHWFTEIKNEPHSFTPPVFQIAWKGKTSSEVRGYGPSKTVGCENDSHKLKGINAIGDYAEYKLKIHRSGLYKVSISTTNTNMDGMILKASCAESEVKSEITNSWTQELGLIALEAGEHTFKLEVTEIKGGVSREIKELKAIQFDLEDDSMGLSDSLATKETALLFRNLKNIGREGIIFGQHLACYEAQNWKDNNISTDFNSDCFTALGDHPGVFGFDFGRGITIFKKYCEEIYRRGGILTYSWHADNPASGGNVNDVSGNPVASILAGGTAQQNWTNELDKVAGFLNNLEVDGIKIPIIFRPFHENTGAWFWWGTGNCSNQEYINLWRFTIDYLRIEKGVHNILVAYSPSKPSLNETLARAMYPGDDYVDIIGFDSYQQDSELKSLVRDGARLVCNWAKESKKVPAMTEIGIRKGLQNSTSTDMFMDGFLNQFKNDEVGKNIAYVLTWMNTSTDSYWTPLQGQPNYNSFVDFYNDSTTYFLKDIENIYGETKVVPEDTVVPVESKMGMLKLKNVNENWQWVLTENEFVANIGFITEAGNITLDTTSSDFISVSSVYTGVSNILKIGGENEIVLPETAWFGTGNSSPALRIIYKTPEKVQGIISSEVKFDGAKEQLNTSFVFNASENWDTLFVSLNTMQNYRLEAKDLVLESFSLLYPSTPSSRLNIDIKEIAYGAVDLIKENDKLTGTNLFANSKRKNLNIYPNPTTNKVTIDLPNNRIEKLFLYDNLGKCIKELNVTPDTVKVEFNVKGYNSGIYYVRAESNNRNLTNRYNGIFLKN